jgi:proteasome lid subunit RPN8/RPN11
VTDTQLALTVKCPLCYRPAGAVCCQPTGPDPAALCQACGAAPGEDCRQGPVCHRSRGFAAERAAKRKASRSARNGSKPTPGKGPARPGNNGNGNGAEPALNSRPSSRPGTQPSALNAGGRPNGHSSALDASRPARWREVRLRADETVKGLTVTLAARAWKTIIHELQLAAGRVETGGVLLGIRRRGELFVTDCGGPGPRSEQSPTRLKRDGLHDLQLAQELGRWAGVVEIGTWHSHPISGATYPSQSDLQGMALGGEFIDTPPPPYVELIATAPNNNWRQPELHGWVTQVGDRDARRRWYHVLRIPVERAGYGE